MPRLVVNPGTEQAWEIQLAPGVTTLGSGPDNTVPLAHESVSAQHCQITVTDGGVMIKDLGSDCGTFVNHAPVDEARLTPGQTITLGEVELRLLADESLAGRPAAAREAAVIPGDGHCKYHPKAVATWACAHCHASYCDLCVTIRHGSSARFCRRCGNECARVRVRVAEEPMQGFFSLLAGAFNYALKGNGPVLLVAGTVFLLLVDFASYTAAFGPYGFVALLIITVFSSGYLFNYAKQIVTSTALGEASPPDWPDLTDFKEDVLMPFGQLLALVVLCFGPSLALRWWHPWGQHYASLASTAALILGALLAPMAMLALAMFDSIGALNPVALFWSIARIPLHYLVGAAAFELVIGIHLVAGHLLNWLLPVPFLPQIIAAFVSLYVLTTAMRIIGLLYLADKESLGWFSR